jgi:hypothetical protein
VGRWHNDAILIKQEKTRIYDIIARFVEPREDEFNE